MTDPDIAVIIVAREMNAYLRESISHCLRSSFRNFEIIVVLDKKTDETFSKTHIFVSSETGPAKKRDFGARKTKAGIVVFLDDDAFPSVHWLKTIHDAFASHNIAGVGGPGVTPPKVSWKEEASGWASSSPLGSAQYVYRFLPMKTRFVDDYPSMNLAVRRAEFISVGGFDSNYYPGEDTKLCLDIVHKRRKKILYHPKALVYHHRRPLWKAHLKQHGNYGVHRGYFARALPRTSARISYFMPSMLLLVTVFLAAGTVPVLFRFITAVPVIILYFLSLACFVLYAIMLILNAFWVYGKSGKVKMALLSIPTIYLTHLWYGIRFIQGFFMTRRLHS